MIGDAKCKCQNCSEPISFSPSLAGQTIVCPHCNTETMLFISTAEFESTKEPVEQTLERIGEVFFFGGILCAVICGFGILIETRNDNTSLTIPLIVCAIVSIAQGWIVQTLFRALAEIIRLLRQMVKLKP